MAVLQVMRDNKFSGLTIENCDVKLEDGTVDKMNIALDGQTISTIWQACCDSIIHRYAPQEAGNAH